MGTLYFKVAADWEEVQRLRSEIDKLKSSLESINSQTPQQVVSDLESKLKSCVDQYRAMITEAAKAGSVIDNEFKKSLDSLDFKNPTEQLKAFDSELVKMAENLSGYFDSLQSKLQGMSDILGGGKTIAGNISVNQDNIAQLEEIKQKNSELTSEIQRQQEEIAKQKKAWDDLASALRTNNTQAIQQYSQATQQIDTGSLKEQSKQLTSDIKEQEKEVESLRVQWEQALSSLTDYENILNGKKAGNTTDAYLHIDEARDKEKQLDDAYAQASQTLEEQKQKQIELNAQIQQGAGHQVRMRTQIMNAREDLMKMIAAGQMNTVEFSQMAQQAGSMRRQMMLANAAMQYYANPAKHLAAFKAGLQGVTGAASVLTGVMGLMNTKSEKMSEIQTKVMSLMSITVGLEQVWTNWGLKSASVWAIKELQTKASAVATKLETAAQSENIIVTKSATIAQAAFNAIAKMNPYVLLASAIITLVGGIYILTRALGSQNEAQKIANERAAEAEKLHNEYAQSVAQSASKQIVSYEELKHKYTELGNNLKDKKKFIDENQKAFQGLGFSVSNVKEAENFFIGNTGNVINALMLRAESAATTALAEKELEKALALEKNGGKIKVSYKAATKEEYLRAIKAGIPNYKETKSVFGAGGAATEDTNYYIADENKNKQENDKAWKKLKDNIDYHKKNAMDFQKKSYDDDKKFQSELKSGNIKPYTEDETKKTEKEKVEKETYVDDYTRENAVENAKKRLMELQEKSEDEIWKNKISLMKDGTDKTIEQINYDFANESAEIEAKQKEEVKAIQNAEYEQWKKNNPDYKKKNLQFTPTEGLSYESVQKYASLRLQAIAKMESSTKKAYSSGIESLLSYEEKKKMIEDNANRTAEVNIKNNPNLTNDQKSKLLENLSKQTKKNIADLNDEMYQEISKNSDVLIKLFSNTSEMSTAEIQRIIDKVKVLLDYIGAEKDAEGNAIFRDKNGNITRTIGNKELSEAGFTKKDAEIIKNNPQALREVRKSTTDAENVLKRSNPFKQLSSDIKDLFNTNLKDSNGGNVSTEAKLKKLGSSVSQVSDMAGNAAYGLQKIFEASGNQGAADAAQAVGDVATSVSNIGKGFAQGGLIGGIAAAAGEAINWAGKVAAANARHKAALLEIQKEILAEERAYTLELIKEEIEAKNLQTIFGTDVYGKAKSALSAYQKSVNELGKSIKTLNDIEIVTGHKKTGLFGTGAGKDLYTDILKVYPKLIDENGNFNESLAETILATRKMSDEDKAAFQNMIDLYKEEEDALDSVKSYLNNIFGDFGNTISDALVQAAENGTDAFSVMCDSVGNMLSKLAQQMIYSVTIEPAIEKAQKNMLAIMQDTSKSSEQKFSGYVDALNALTNDAEAQSSTFTLLWNKYKEIAKEKGIYISATSSSSSATVGASSSMSQDTGNDISGRMTAIEELEYERNNKLDTMQKTLLDLTPEDIRSTMNDGPDLAKEISNSLKESYLLHQNFYGNVQMENISTQMATLAKDLSETRGIVDEMRTSFIESVEYSKYISENSVKLAKSNNTEIVPALQKIANNTSSLSNR